MKTSNHTVGVLPTEFVSPEQTALLSQALELTAEQVEQVAGGALALQSPLSIRAVCQCVNCCSNHLTGLKALPTLAIRTF
jgi:hypothetical protein